MRNNDHLDEIDIEIIGILMEDGRTPAVEIANRMGEVSERTVRNRLRTLLENKLVRIGALPDPASLGWNVVADVFVHVKPGEVYKVARRLADYENISYVACTTGDMDISIQVAAVNVSAVHLFVTNEIGTLPGVVKTQTNINPVILKTFGYKTKDFDKIDAMLEKKK